MINNPIYILIISSDQTAVDIIKANYRAFAPNAVFVVAGSADAARRRLLWVSYHLILLDEALPKNDVDQIAQRVRAHFPQLPLLIISRESKPADLANLRPPAESRSSVFITKCDLTDPESILQGIHRSHADAIGEERLFQTTVKQRRLLLQKLEHTLFAVAVPGR